MPSDQLRRSLGLILLSEFAFSNKNSYLMRFYALQNVIFGQIYIKSLFSRQIIFQILYFPMIMHGKMGGDYAVLANLSSRKFQQKSGIKRRIAHH